MTQFGYKTNNWSKVYFIQGENGGPIKIGYTDKIANRLKQMQTGNPDNLVLLHLTSGGKIMEEQLHNQFSEYHYRGEWYYPAKEILDYIHQLKIKAENEKPLLTIVELSLAFGEILTTNEKKLLQEMVNGVKLSERDNWDRYKALLRQYNEYRKDPEGFIAENKRYMNL